MKEMKSKPIITTNGARIEVLQATDLKSLQTTVNEFIAELKWKIHDIQIISEFTPKAIITYDINLPVEK
jgi:hypothetical protein